MALVNLVMPKMGESIMEATIIKWNKNVGDRIGQDETVLEIATDKVDSEVPSPTDGTITELKYKAGDVVPVGEVIAVIDTAAKGSAPTAAAPVAAAPAPAPAPVAPAPVAAPVAAPVSAIAPAVGVNGGMASAMMAEPSRGRFYSPLVLNIARQEGIGMDELDRLPGTGQEGRVTKKDILDYVQGGRRAAQPASAPATYTAPAAPAPAYTAPVFAEPPKPIQVDIQAPPTAAPAAAAKAPEAPAAPKAPSGTAHSGNYVITVEGQSSAAANKKRTFSISGDTEIIEMDRMRKMISENMVYSKHTSPHVTSWVEADVTNIVLWRERNKKQFEKTYNEKLTYTPMFMMALARALRDFPMVNIAVDGDKIILRKDINLGMAVALPSGNLIVPVVKKADQLNLAGMARGVNDLTNRGRNGKLTMDDLENGTYTLSNVGSFGNLMGTPIIMQPQVAILAVGAIKKKPAVLETPQGDVIAVRHMMFLSHSYDHRVVDGMLGGSFVRRVADYLEQWDLDMPV
jgi:2-oxoglutarate dehydrogenase E2 component (dihydrolipoamide succinyltransferase)